MNGHLPGSEYQSTPRNPKYASRWLNSPSSTLNSENAMNETTTHDRKYGAMKMV